jgi:membrane-anchored mycosin MYCP
MSAGRRLLSVLAGPWVDVAAPGEGVVSLDPDGEGLVSSLPSSGDPIPISGTSYAAPVVSGIVALVRSRSPELTARQVMRRIEETAHRPAAGWDPVVGHGVVDAWPR